MSFSIDLSKQIENYILYPENIIDEVIRTKCKDIHSLTEKQMADICAIRRNTFVTANKFKYSLDDLDLIIKTIDSDPHSSFAKLRDAIRQIEFILDKNSN